MISRTFLLTHLESEIGTVLRTGHRPDRSCVPSLGHSDHRTRYPETTCQHACNANWKSAGGSVDAMSACYNDSHVEARTWKGYPNLPSCSLPTDPLFVGTGNVPLPQ